MLCSVHIDNKQYLVDSKLMDIVAVSKSCGLLCLDVNFRVDTMNFEKSSPKLNRSGIY